MRPEVYDQHDAAFKHVSAYVIMKDSERVATIALKFPKDGEGRLYAYVHYIGAEMVRAYAGGYGYDKRSAAITHAASKIPAYKANCEGFADHEIKMNAEIDAFKAALSDIGGKDWADALRDSGYQALKAV